MSLRRNLTLFLVAFILVGSAAFAQISKIPANPQAGFRWPYYLYVPAVLKSPTVLLVEPNNSGTPTTNPSEDDSRAYALMQYDKFRGDDLGSPLLIPTFPRPASNWETYTQALDRDTLTTNLPNLSRIDLQLIAMIDDARARLAVEGISVGSRVWIIGFSASGAFSNRFAILHPDRVLAVSAGAGAEYATAPVSVWKGRTLRYPVGVADLQQLIGKSFDAEAFRKVAVQIYIGDEQLGDAVDYTDGFDPEDAALIKSVFGGPTFKRYPASEAAYKSIGANCQFVIFPGLDHKWPAWGFIRDFLERNRTSPLPPALPKPMLYKLYFPHAASDGVWETEVAVINTSEVSVQGEMQAFTASGSQIAQSMPITLPPLGRKQIIVGSAFQNPEHIAYLALVSDSGFLAGYTRFTQPGSRATLAAGIGTKQGWFPKMEKKGYTGIAFVNVDNAEANVDLVAFDANGTQVATHRLKLKSGEKYVGMVDQLFSVNLTNATYFKFKSEGSVLAFTVSASEDNRMLDGLHSLSNYIYID
jgi:pimeloyl-ACP methyl ester carboxylesterase